MLQMFLFQMFPDCFTVLTILAVFSLTNLTRNSLAIPSH